MGAEFDERSHRQADAARRCCRSLRIVAEAPQPVLAPPTFVPAGPSTKPRSYGEQFDADTG
jgi:hypothetical protein